MYPIPTKCKPCFIHSPFSPHNITKTQTFSLVDTQTQIFDAGAVTGVTTGTTGVTTLPAPITTTTVPMMATMAPGIAIGILKALLIGSTFKLSFDSDFMHFQLKLWRQ